MTHLRKRLNDAATGEAGNKEFPDLGLRFNVDTKK
jgi:hypothetical protein